MIVNNKIIAQLSDKNCRDYGLCNLWQFIYPVLFPSGVYISGKQKKYHYSIRQLSAKPVRNLSGCRINRVQDAQVRVSVGLVGAAVVSALARPTAFSLPARTQVVATVMVYVQFVVRSVVNDP